MGEVAVGDRLLGADGRSCVVTAKSEVFTGKRCYAFTFDGGGRVVCSADHLWRASSPPTGGGAAR
jgi:replicative DNA helicase